MRWACTLYPQLPLEILSPPVDRPCAIVEPRGNRRPLTFVSALAEQRGIHRGMSQSSATGLVPDLLVLTRKPELEDAAWQALACRAYGFGSPVVLDASALAIWVEVERSIQMFGGWKPLARALQEPEAHLNYAARIAVAPTLSSAHLIASVSEKPRRPVTRVADLPAALAAVPIQALPFDEDSLQMLHGAGLRRIGEVLAIPSASLGKRIGTANLIALQKLLGQTPEAWEAWVPATRYVRRWDFDEGIETTHALLFPLRIVMTEFVAYLKVRDLSVQHFHLRLVDSRKRVVIHPVGLLSPTRDPQRLLLVLREQLDRVALEDPVMSVSVEAERFEPASAVQNDLFADISTQLGERLTELRERLSARLGAEVVQQLAVSPDQRPQATQSARGGCQAVRGKDHPDRPLWLLEKPQRAVLRRVLTPPERIELGWWDESGPALQRDYVVGEDKHGRLCWAYREQGQGEWQLHGLWQ